jgi:hypothetical protein
VLDLRALRAEAVLVRDTTTTKEPAMNSTSTLAYSSSTGTGTTYLAPEFGTTPAAETTTYDEYWDEYCFVCSRCTNHVGEHEELVAAGMAEYEGGTVVKTERYDREKARAICEAGYVAYTAGPAAYEAFCKGLEGGVTA